MASYGSHPSYGTQPSYGGAPENGQSPYGAGGPFGGMQQPQAPQQYNYKAPKASNGVATAAFVLALVNILLFVIPGVGAIIGLVVMLLGFIGLIKSGGLQKSGRVFSVIAMLLGLGQAGANVGGTYLIFDVAKKSFQSAQYVYDASDAVKLYQAEHGVLPDQIPLGAPTVDAWGESLGYEFFPESGTFRIWSNNMFDDKTEDDLVFDSTIDEISMDGDTESYNRKDVQEFTAVFSE